MAVPRGLKNIRTLAGKVDRIAEPYRAYMQVTCLEMEKARRMTERRSASQRIRDLDSRLREIEVEKTGLLEALAGEYGERLDARGKQISSDIRRGPAGFRLKY